MKMKTLTRTVVATAIFSMGTLTAGAIDVSVAERWIEASSQPNFPYTLLGVAANDDGTTTFYVTNPENSWFRVVCTPLVDGGSMCVSGAVSGLGTKARLIP
jgi:hypothetical protein